MEIGSWADWVSGLGSILAIGGIWWQSREESKKIKLQFDHEDELRKKLDTESSINQKKKTYRASIQHLENIKSDISLIKQQIAHKKKHPQTIHEHLKMLSIMIDKSSKYIQDELSQISHELVDEELVKLIKTGIVYRSEILKFSLNDNDIEKSKLNLAIIDHNAIKLTIGCKGDGSYDPKYTTKYSACKEDHKTNNKLLLKNIDNLRLKLEEIK